MNEFIPDKILSDKENHQILRPINEESLIELEIVKTGYANGVAEGYPLSSEEKDEMINKASHAFGLFLDALKCD